MQINNTVIIVGAIFVCILVIYVARRALCIV